MPVGNKPPLQLTSTQRNVLQKLDDPDWIIEPTGKDGMAGKLYGPRWRSQGVSAKTLTFLLNNRLISSACDGITMFRTTAAGREAIGKPPTKE